MTLSRWLRIWPALAAAAILAPAPQALAAAAVTLTDGQVIRGSVLERKGDAYNLTTAGGTVVVIPVAGVAAIRFEDDPAPKSPPGFDTAGPRTLAGPAKLPSQSAKDQLKALGPPTQWAPNVVDTTWTPTNAFDMTKDVFAMSRTTWQKNLIDTTWTPVSAFDMTKDVFAMSHATWPKNLIDTTWTPSDGFGFKPLTWNTPAPPERYPLTFAPEEGPPAAPEAPAADAGPPPVTPWSCGETLLARGGRTAPSITVTPLRKREYAALGLALYEAKAGAGAGSTKAIFTIADGTCRLLGGDAGTVVGLNLPADLTMAQDVASFNAAVASRDGAALPAGVDPLDFAYALVSLTDPRVSGSSPAVFKLVTKPEDLKAIAATESATVSASRSVRRKAARAAVDAFAAPKIAAEPEGTVITFLTWSSSGGRLVKNTVVLGRDGLVTAKRDVLVEHVGAYFD